MAEQEENNESESAQPRELIEVDDELIRDIEDIVKSRSEFLLLNILQDLYPADIAHIINRVEVDETNFVFNLLPNEIGSEVLLDLDDVHRERLLATLPQLKLTELVDKMDFDDGGDILGGTSGRKAGGGLE